MVLRPDCADLPYFLRAYFAFKMGLPFGFSKCTRGGGGRAPSCVGWTSIQNADAARQSEPLPPPGTPAAASAPPPKPLGLAASFGTLFEDHRRQRPFRIRADRARRQQHRLLSRVAQPGDAAPGHRVRRSVRAHSGAGAARAAGGRRRGRVPRRRRAARRDGGAQALLARQFPVRAGSRARRPRLQALPADRARHGRRAAAADQRADREKSAVRRFFARTGEAWDRGLLRPDGRRDVAVAARSAARDEGGDHVARRAGEDARDVGRERAEIPEQRQGRSEHAGRSGDLRDDRPVGGFLDAVAGSAPADRDRRGARHSRIASRGGPSATRCRGARAPRT